MFFSMLSSRGSKNKSSEVGRTMAGFRRITWICLFTAMFDVCSCSLKFGERIVFLIGEDVCFPVFFFEFSHNPHVDEAS